jgi:hypothetical protein
MQSGPIFSIQKQNGKHKWTKDHVFFLGHFLELRLNSKCLTTFTLQIYFSINTRVLTHFRNYIKQHARKGY